MVYDSSVEAGLKERYYLPSPVLCLEWLKRPSLWGTVWAIFVHGQCIITTISDWELYHRSFLDLDVEEQVSKQRKKKSLTMKKDYLGCCQEELHRNPQSIYLDDSQSQIICTLILHVLFYYQNQLPDLKIGEFRWSC